MNSSDTKTPLERFADQSIALRLGGAPHGEISVADLACAISVSTIETLDRRARQNTRIDEHTSVRRAADAQAMPAIVPVAWNGGWLHLCSRAYLISAMAMFTQADVGALRLLDDERLQEHYERKLGGTLMLHSQYLALLAQHCPQASQLHVRCVPGAS